MREIINTSIYSYLLRPFCAAMIGLPLLAAANPALADDPMLSLKPTKLVAEMGGHCAQGFTLDSFGSASPLMTDVRLIIESRPTGEAVETVQISIPTAGESNANRYSDFVVEGVCSSHFVVTEVSALIGGRRRNLKPFLSIDLPKPPKVEIR